MALQEVNRIILQAPNCGEVLILHFATTKAGVIHEMILPAYRAFGISFLREHSKAKAILVASTCERFDFQEMCLE